MPKGGPAASSEPPGPFGGDVAPERSSLPFRRGLRSDMAIIRTCPGLSPPPDQSAFENMAPQEKPVSENPVYQDLGNSRPISRPAAPQNSDPEIALFLRNWIT